MAIYNALYQSPHVCLLRVRLGELESSESVVNVFNWILQVTKSYLRYARARWIQTELVPELEPFLRRGLPVILWQQISLRLVYYKVDVIV